MWSIAKVREVVLVVAEHREEQVVSSVVPNDVAVRNLQSSKP
jgi:hypothetical protein